jgi:hypothetical protein
MGNGLLHEACASGGIPYIPNERDGVLTGGGYELLRGSGLVQGTVNGDLCASLSECFRNCRAKATGRSGDKRDLILQAELIEYQGNLSFPAGDYQLPLAKTGVGLL